MVGDDIDNNLNTSLVKGFHHFIKVGKGTDLWVDISVICDVVYQSAKDLTHHEKENTYNHRP
jgi:hypothetical protein